MSNFRHERSQKSKTAGWCRRPHKITVTGPTADSCYLAHALILPASIARALPHRAAEGMCATQLMKM